MADAGIEAVASQEGVGTLPPLARIGDPLQGSGMTGEEAPRGALVRGSARLVVGRRLDISSPSVGERLGDRLGVDPLLTQLRLEGALAPWPRPVPGFKPSPGKGRVVEDAEVGQPFDGRGDQVLAIAG